MVGLKDVTEEQGSRSLIKRQRMNRELLCGTDEITNSEEGEVE
jgi:hypothetical protein